MKEKTEENEMRKTEKKTITPEEVSKTKTESPILTDEELEKVTGGRENMNYGSTEQQSGTIICPFDGKMEGDGK